MKNTGIELQETVLMMESIKKGSCPSCGSRLRPFTSQSRRKDRTRSIDCLRCSKCNIQIKSSYIRKGQINNIKKELDYQREVKKRKHGRKPPCCAGCGSKNIRKDAEKDYMWECLDCKESYLWKIYTCAFSGDIDVYASDEDMATMKAYDLIEQADLDVMIVGEEVETIEEGEPIEVSQNIGLLRWIFNEQM